MARRKIGGLWELPWLRVSVIPPVTEIPKEPKLAQLKIAQIEI
jgi:hypothetical protein